MALVPGRDDAAEAFTTRDAELAFLALLLRLPKVRPTPDAGVDDGERKKCLLAVCNYYRATHEEIEEITAGCATATVDEIPLILHLSRYAGIDVSSILALRSEGLSWMEVGVRLNIERDSFYVPLASPTTLMPGTSYRDYARRARAAWLIPGLTDADLVNLVNLKFISEYYRCPSEHVIALHSTGWSYSAMHGVLAGLTERAPVARRPSSRRGARDHSQKV